jgi:hypothetical protein
VTINHHRHDLPAAVAAMARGHAVRGHEQMSSDRWEAAAD